MASGATTSGPGAGKRWKIVFRAAIFCLTLSTLGAAGPAWSQEPQTREEADRQRREQQAKEAEPYQPNGLERAIDIAADRNAGHDESPLSGKPRVPIRAESSTGLALAST